ncbi:hypothetical protein JW960_26885 [candidate division KSB1 bacterium]|nr:hypothetical protein [candidate division KSB1 bacterium]
MEDYFNSLNTIQKFYLICAAVGGISFLLRTIMMFMAGDTDMDTDMDGDISTEHHSSDTSFKLLSVQGLTAFFMMFGLVSLALSTESHFSDMLAMPVGVMAGLFTVWVIGKIFVSMKKLHSEGTLKIENAVGEEGIVYLNIRENGTGQAQIAIQGQLKIFDAVSSDNTPMKTGERIVVEKIIRGNVLVVKRVN